MSSDKIKDGGPAFPWREEDGEGGYDQHRGMSLRDYFAGQAMAAVIAHSELTDKHGNFTAKPGKGYSTLHMFALFAYTQADAMLVARNAKP